MLTRIRRRMLGRGHGPWIVVAAVLVALLVTPFALAAGENRPLRGGARNPSPNAQLSFTRETQIIANNATFGTRQSNKSTTGGGAIYGCRARTGTRSCLRASNLSNGRAFSFSANSGTEVGRIDGPAAAAPFTTSATGVATGLNADKVDGKDAETITADANRFATVSAAGALGNQRGATSATNTSAGTYSVAFSDDISKCALAATVNANTVAGIATAVITADNKTVTVVTRDAANPATPVNEPFHLTVTC